MGKVLHEERLRQVHPALVLLVRTWQVQCKFDVKVGSGVRTDVEQAELYAQGRTTPGPIVTNAPNTVMSAHGLRWVNGRAMGCAIDVFPVDGQGARWDNSDAYEEMWMWASRRHDVEWGGRWEKFHDAAHWQILTWKAYPPAPSATPPSLEAVRTP